jgi:Flp pilus assembly pilin Flp
VISLFRALFTTNDEGNAVTEYAICLALIVLASILAVNALGVAISELFPNLASLVS